MKTKISNPYMKTKSTIAVLLMLFLTSIQLYGQDVLTIPYSMSFEEADSVELQKWVMNAGPRASLCQDQWIVGSATHSDGKRALYISRDETENAFFGSSPNVQYVYRDFQLPTGSYEISFDWRCVGAAGTGLYVGLGLSTCKLEANPVSSAYGTEPEQWLQFNKKIFNGTSLWKNESFSANAKAGRTLRLFFMWVSSNTDTTLTMPISACIDNVQITSANCAKPTSLTAQATCDTVYVQWKGTSEQYAFEYRKRGSDKWRVQTGIYDNKYIIEGLEEGMYDMRVRGICNQVDTSAYMYLNSFILFCPERHCINYVNLKDSENVTTTIGNYQNPYATVALVDEGYDNEYKRHTVCWEPDEFDPRTANQLMTIPEGELASVRLGNWHIGAEAESVSYQYTVDAENNAILLLKYAIVMEDPNHTKNQQPRFKLEILDGNGAPVDPTCGAADFYADMRREGWHVNANASTPVTWKDWTVIGLNLEDYDGQTLTIRLTTYDCAASGHYGYAYFTLGCAAAKIYGTSCGDEANMNISAPDGFDYTWYDKDDNVVAKTKEFSVLPSDTTTYRCHLSYKESADCGFDLFTSARPRFPIAEFDYSYVPSECTNKVIFNNKSHIMTKFGEKEEHHYDELCEEYVWDFGDGNLASETNPRMTYPNEGGTFPVKLYAMISEGQCVDSMLVNVVIPAIGDSEQKIDSTICEGSYITLGDKNAIGGQKLCAETGVYSVTWKDVAGCDSTITINLTLNPVDKIQLPDTIVCAEVPLVVDGRTYRYQATMKEGEFYLDPYYKNRFGCDSILWMKVTVLDSILPEVKMQDIQGDQEYSGKIFLSGTGYTYYYINGDYHPASDSVISGLNGGTFELTFFNDLGCSVSVTEKMKTPCRNLIFQRWNDVLSVMNSEAQAKRSPDQPELAFTSFQWMKDSVDIPNETLSYYYEADGLDLNSFYQVRVTTVDNEVMISCPFYPEEYKKQAPKREKRIENQRLIIIIDGVRYNAQGQRL